MRSQSSARAIGPIGTAARALGGLALLYVAGGATVGSWAIDPEEAAIGLVLFPAIMIAAGLVANRLTDGPIRLTGAVGTAANCGVLVVLFLNPTTAPAAALFYGATMVIAAWRGQAGCEGTVISNWILGREDAIGCPIFSPIDRLEARGAPEVAGG